MPTIDLLARGILTLLPLSISLGITRCTRRVRTDPRARATPPGWVFSVVWTTLYLVLGALLAALLVPSEPRKALSRGTTGALLTLLVLHLGLTYAWTPLYTAGRKRASLYLIVGILASALALQTLLKAAEQTTFAVLLAPYIAWLIFALLLNYEAVTLVSVVPSRPQSQ